MFFSHHDVPHLTTALHGPLQHIESTLLTRQSDIEAWLRAEWHRTPAPFYASVDLRNAGFKLAPVDTNLFPAGFNNLNPAFFPLCVQALQSAVERVCPMARRVLVIPENHTRNPFYLQSLATLMGLFTKAGFTARLGTLDTELAREEPLPMGRHLRFEPLRREADTLFVGSDAPCLVLLNNDLSGGRPAILEELAKQTVVPPLDLGWSRRLKSAHFTHYRNVAQEFAELLNLDAWLIDPLFRNCGEIDFMKREGEECLADNVEALLAAVRRKYTEYGIDKPPFVVIKADAGTYGMAVMMVRDVGEIRNLNRKQRTRMAATKEGQSVSKDILQEGVHTFETLGTDESVAEPVVYMIDHYVVGGFYRVHTQKGPDENLNAPGMHFEPLAFAACCNTPDCDRAPDDEPNRFYAYGVIARLALLAAAREIAAARAPAATQPEPEALAMNG